MKKKTTPVHSSELVKTYWNLMGRLSWAARRPETWPEKDLPDFSSASRSRSKVFLVLKKSRQFFGVMNWQKPLRCLVRWFMCSCLLPRAPAACPLLHLALCELVQGAKPLENSSSSLARSFSADGARCLGFWDSAEAAGTGEQAESCVQSWTRSCVTLLLVAACDWIRLGISVFVSTLSVHSSDVDLAQLPILMLSIGDREKIPAWWPPMGQNVTSSHVGNARITVSSYSIAENHDNRACATYI